MLRPVTPSERTILHVDLDAFYASVEQRDRPELRGRAIVVGGPTRRGVVLAASYESRRFGVASAMPVARALKLCPLLIVVPPRMSHYAEVSEEFFAILHQYAPLVEGLSLDEAFLDVTGCERLLGDGPAIACALKERIRNKLGLIASVGVAPSKFVAKVASDCGKPDGLVVVRADDVVRFLHALPVWRLWGVGRVTEQELARMGVRTIGDVARMDVDVLARRLGAEHARHLHDLADGRDERPVVPDRAPVSLGSEDTFDKDVHEPADLAISILAQADRTCARLRRAGLRGRVVMLKVKYADHALVTRRTTLGRATADGRTVGRVACRLLEDVPHIASRGVRLTGVALSGLAREADRRQLPLDSDESRREEGLGRALDEIADRFGGGAVRRAIHVDAQPSPSPVPRGGPRGLDRR